MIAAPRELDLRSLSLSLQRDMIAAPHELDLRSLGVSLMNSTFALSMSLLSYAT